MNNNNNITSYIEEDPLAIIIATVCRFCIVLYGYMHRFAVSVIIVQNHIRTHISLVCKCCVSVLYNKTWLFGCNLWDSFGQRSRAQGFSINLVKKKRSKPSSEPADQISVRIGPKNVWTWNCAKRLNCNVKLHYH